MKTYQACRNDWFLNGHDSFLVEGGKYGLGRRDLAANLNLFSKVAVTEDGTMVFDPANSPAGSVVTLRFEMDTLVLLHTCPHPMNPSPDYPKTGDLSAFADPPGRPGRLLPEPLAGQPPRIREQSSLHPDRLGERSC